MKIERSAELWGCELCFRRAACCIWILAVLAAKSSHADGLNDTGQTLCYDAANTPLACSAAIGGDAGVNPRQDGRYGRDATAAAGRLTKVGGGSAGFDYTKIANDGSTLPSTATLGDSASDWACTKDNVTGLVWELKTASGLRRSAHTYTWYSTDGTSNGGDAGALGTDTCGGSLAAAPYNNHCNTQYFVAAVNAVGLCGARDWRLPSPHELLTVLHAGNHNPAMESEHFPITTFFPTFNFFFWTKTTYAANPRQAWMMEFFFGNAGGDTKTTSTNGVRLVRGGP